MEGARRHKQGSCPALPLPDGWQRELSARGNPWNSAFSSSFVNLCAVEPCGSVDGSPKQLQGARGGPGGRVLGPHPLTRETPCFTVGSRLRVRFCLEERKGGGEGEGRKRKKRKEAREKGRKEETFSKPLFSFVKMASFFDLQLKERGQARTRRGVRAAETRVGTVSLNWVILPQPLLLGDLAEIP